MYNKKGQALILAYLVLIVLTILASAFLSKAANENRLAQRQRLTQEAIYLAEGGIEDALAKFSDAIANFDIEPDIETYHVDTVYSSFSNATVSSDLVRLEDTDRIVEVEGGAQALVRNYEIIATVTHPLNASIAVTLHQIAARRIIPAFQHAVFYDKDLEILPGPDMNFTGRVHSNEDIYIGANNTLTMDTFYLYSVGDIYNKRKNDGSRMGGDVKIRITGAEPPAYEYMEIDGVYLDSDDPNWTTESQTRWQGTVKSAVHGVTNLAAPQVRSIQPDGYYANQADVKITNETITEAGEELIEGAHIPPGTVTTSITFYNNREDSKVKMTDIDLQKLAGYATEEEYINGTPSFPNHLPTNGLLYATRDDAGALYQPGIRLVNGAEIARPGGLTVVTNDPLYIQGDYNTANKKPAAVITDALNLLSNAWDVDARSHGNLNQRRAEETTINTAFIAGIDDTDPENNQYNGGLENYPRMHERWTGVNLNIRGAFLALWNSQIATGAWLYGNPQYTAPRRNWDYDTDFNDTGNLPPFTPWVVEMERVAWWKE